jgi:hypothetical protein
LLAGAGLQDQQIATRLKITPEKVARWRNRFLDGDFAALDKDAPRQRLRKTGGQMVKHARYYWLVLAESHLTRRLFGSIVCRIAALAVPSE